MTEITEAKRRARLEARRRSAEFPDAYFKEAGRGISERALALREYIRADTVLGFASIGKEPDTSLFLRAALSEKRLALPLCTGAGIMEAREIRSLRDLRPGKYGIPEPAPDCPLIPAEEIRFALIPCAACCTGGRRLGRGGGYYDRYLAGYSGAAALACPAALLLEDIPVGEFDVSIPLVITECAVYRNGEPVLASPAKPGCGRTAALQAFPK